MNQSTQQQAAPEKLRALVPNSPEVQAFNDELLAYVQTWGPITFTALYEAFGDIPATPQSHRRLHNRIAQLAYAGKLVNVASGRVNLWAVGDGNSAPAGHRPRQAASPALARKPVHNAVPAPSQVVPPRRLNWMESPVYVPPATQRPTRPGALDFMACPSRGNRC